MSQASIINPVTVSNEREIQPMDLPIEQLNNLKMQHEEELRELQKQMESLAGIDFVSFHKFYDSNVIF